MPSSGCKKKAMLRAAPGLQPGVRAKVREVLADLQALECKDHRDFVVFFFNDTATPEIYTLSLHDALPIRARCRARSEPRTYAAGLPAALRCSDSPPPPADRKSTRLNSSHMSISYAVFCLKKKKKKNTITIIKTKKEKR